MIFILFVITGVLLVVYLKQKYFTLHGYVPGLAPQFLFGNLLQSGFFNGNSPPMILSTFQKRFGDVFQFWFGPSRFIVINNITDVEHVLTHRNIYDQGDIFIEKFSINYSQSLISTKGLSQIASLWPFLCKIISLGIQFKRHSSIVSPLFRRSKVISHFDLIIGCTDKLLTKWRKTEAKTIHVDIVSQCHNLVLAIFGFIAFDYDLETLDDGDNELTLALRTIINSIMTILALPRILAKAYVTLSYRQRQARNTIERYIYRMIEHEQATAQGKHTSLIASLVHSLRMNEHLEATEDIDEDKRGLSRNEVVDEMVAFLIAGFESTSSTLVWFIHLVSKHAQVQQKIKAELIAQDCLYHLSSDRLDSLVYLNCVINEVLRFIPPATGTIRTLTRDDCLPATNVQLVRGDSVLIPFHSLAHDPRYWSVDPNLFYPERFLGEDQNHHPYALIPFGGGHRQCIGQDLARFELKVIVARLMQKITFDDAGPEVNAGGHSMGLAILPKHIGVSIEFD
ncbi:unnamed protein product [Adineta ricciae]|uniref:Cytochrome P450 n=1 Tax=Adineta ricciae TaxID=249248 RepID=A0A815AGJ4_ADIRI|nr:unnamed protein product [Adineta ricciae]